MQRKIEQTYAAIARFIRSFIIEQKTSNKDSLHQTRYRVYKRTIVKWKE